MTTPPGAPPVRGELWTVAQCCAYWGKDRGTPLSRTTFFDYVRKGYAPQPLPWSNPSGGRLWDSAAVIEAYDARVGVGGRSDPDGWVAVRDAGDGRRFWRGPEHQQNPATPALEEARTWKTQALARKALAAAFGHGNRWAQPKWDGWAPMRRAGAALLDQAAAAELPERDMTVLRRRAEGATLRVLGDEMRLSRERVRQIEADAIAALGQTTPH